MSTLGLIYRLYSLAVPLAFFALILYNWFIQFYCLQCTFNIWEPNLIIHTYEFVMMLVALPGLAQIAWRALE
jgi:hypothetical protein